MTKKSEEGKICNIFSSAGSSNGIGRGTAVLFAKEGAKVTITGRNASTLEVISHFVTTNRECVQETKQLCLNSGAKESEILEVVLFYWNSN